jgi:phenylacetic acid degradation operon negative regulatory protein
MSNLNIKLSHADQPTIRTQFLIFTLFGEYVLERGGSIWTSDLLYLMEMLDVGEQATRSILSRMTRKDWIVPHKQGRHSQYSLTSRGRDLLQRGKRRIFEPIITEWDGKWQMIVYSLPENKRHQRHALRTQLRWLGFGCLAPGIWISSHDPSVEIKDILTELEIAPHVQHFAGEFLGTTSNESLVYRCWDLEGLETQYRDFIEHFMPAYQACQMQIIENRPPDPAECFVRLFWLTYEFQSFPLKDPNLPTSLLPDNWIGFSARKLFESYHTFLAHHANAFVDDVIAGRQKIHPSQVHGELL